MKKPNPPTLGEIEYVIQRVAEWIAAGDVIEEHAELCVDATVKGYVLMRDTFEKNMPIEAFCNNYHAALKAQETMDPKEFYRQKRKLDKVRRDLASGKVKPPW